MRRLGGRRRPCRQRRRHHPCPRWPIHRADRSACFSARQGLRRWLDTRRTPRTRPVRRARYRDGPSPGSKPCGLHCAAWRASGCARNLGRAAPPSTRHDRVRGRSSCRRPHGRPGALCGPCGRQRQGGWRSAAARRARTRSALPVVDFGDRRRSTSLAGRGSLRAPHTQRCGPARLHSQ